MHEYVRGDRVFINRDDYRVEEYLAFAGIEGSTNLSPFYGTVDFVKPDGFQIRVLCDNGEVATFDRYQLEHIEEDGEVVEPAPTATLADHIALGVCGFAVLFVLASISGIW